MTNSANPEHDATGNNLQSEAVKQPPLYRAWFINRFNHKRAGWRFILYLAIGFGAVFALEWTLHMLFPELDKEGLINISSISSSFLQVVALASAGLILLRWSDKRPLDLLGISLTPGWLREFGFGLVLGFGLLTSTAMVLWVTGLMQFQMNTLSIGLVAGMVQALIFVFLISALAELLMRGYTYQAFIEGSRVWIATIALSLIASLMSMANPDFPPLSIINIFLGGLLLSVAYLKTRSLWLPIGLHMAWNWTQGTFWGMGVTGIHIRWSLFSATPQGSDLLSGGAFGPDASIIAAVLLSGLTVWLWKTKLIAPSPYMQSLWQKYPGGYGIPAVNDGTTDA
ncbi:lysostaphin resistance A-like protein [Candidatus Neomarinimicrobiota bacterium]